MYKVDGLHENKRKQRKHGNPRAKRVTLHSRLMKRMAWLFLLIPAGIFLFALILGIGGH